MPPAIRVRNLHKSFDGKPALRGLSLEVGQGEFFGFLGANGAGKTTTIHILTGIMEADSGEAEVLGLPIPERMIEARRLIGVVPEVSILFDRLTGREFLEFAGRMYGVGRREAARRAGEIVELFGLEAHEGKLIAAYSKGMKKRVALGAALIHRPRLFLLDEPFEGVDPVGARLMRDILERQVAAGASVFLTSHVLEVVEKLCSRYAIVDEGRIVAEGDVGRLQAAGGSLEEVFVQTVGAGREPGGSLDWL
jgi:ABC-2 type transport system ATP-binding protein